MKIISQDRKHGFVRIEPESIDDLWVLSTLIEKKDIVKSRTIRKIKVTETAQALKKAVNISIEVDHVEFNETSSTLRITGVIIEAPEDVPKGSFHTITIELGNQFSLTKNQWLDFQWKTLQESALAPPPKILICVFDREQALFAILQKKGHTLLGMIKGEVEKKRHQEKIKTNFYKEIIKNIQEYIARHSIDHVIVASPGFWKEELNKNITDDSLRKKIVQATCSDANENAIKEILKRPELKEVLHMDRVSKEFEAVEKIMSEISKQGIAVYGFNDVEQATELGAVDQLVLTGAFIQKTRHEEKFKKLELIMKSVDKKKGSIMIISSEHEGGKRLDGIGGIAALLRFKI
ncbi:mRNA surveillance protein pelota [Candidatus Woesearchaeota archaeon]|nr:mRNA surveillance protein pelota [Candidatus Woesearchaeota archaeon]